MTVSVRNAAAADAPAIAGLMTELGYPATGEEIRQRLGYWLPDATSRVLLAVRDDQVIGCLSVHAVPYLERTGRWARVETLVVAKEARRDGAGHGLLAAAEDLAATDWGCLAMEVTSARTRDDAHAFYQKRGYEDVSGRSGRFFKLLR
jgi:GNAT superfamily N-acetyltransferase